MTVERDPGVTYIWNDIREGQLENIESWTDAAKKIREITADVKRVAEGIAPVGRPRIDGQLLKIKTSHYQAAGIGKVGKTYRQVVGNRAPHAFYVHDGTEEATGRTIHNSGRWMGPVGRHGGPGAVTLAGPWWPRRSTVRRTRNGSARWRSYPGAVYFDYYVFKGQKSNPWLERAGDIAYHLGKNH